VGKSSANVNKVIVIVPSDGQEEFYDRSIQDASFANDHVLIRYATRRFLETKSIVARATLYKLCNRVIRGDTIFLEYRLGGDLDAIIVSVIEASQVLSDHHLFAKAVSWFNESPSSDIRCLIKRELGSKPFPELQPM